MLQHSVFAASSTAWPVVTRRFPNSLSKTAEPERITISLTQSYATGLIGWQTAVVRATTGENAGVSGVSRFGSASASTMRSLDALWLRA